MLSPKHSVLNVMKSGPSVFLFFMFSLLFGLFGFAFFWGGGMVFGNFKKNLNWALSYERLRTESLSIYSGGWVALL